MMTRRPIMAFWPTGFSPRSIAAAVNADGKDLEGLSFASLADRLALGQTTIASSPKTKPRGRRRVDGESLEVQRGAGRRAWRERGPGGRQRRHHRHDPADDRP